MALTLQLDEQAFFGIPWDNGWAKITTRHGTLIRIKVQACRAAVASYAARLQDRPYQVVPGQGSIRVTR